MILGHASNKQALTLLTPRTKYMRLIAGCRLSFAVTVPTPAIFMLRPRSGEGQRILVEEYLIEPPVLVNEYTDNYGNLCQRFVMPPGLFNLQATIAVESQDEIDVNPEALFVTVDNLPNDVLQFLLPSRHCQSDQMGDLARQIVGNLPPGYQQVEAIRHWIHTHIRYCYGTSNSSTSALDTAQSRIGVCRDFAHLGISLCRALNIPARMAVGYLHELTPMDLHAWFEAFVGDRWYTFDATQAEPKGNRITLAYGQDATDVALATQFGRPDLLEMQVWVNAAPEPHRVMIELLQSDLIAA
jgi:transglutaminase-like putative cysteine protease